MYNYLMLLMVLLISACDDSSDTPPTQKGTKDIEPQARHWATYEVPGYNHNKLVILNNRLKVIASRSGGLYVFDGNGFDHINKEDQVRYAIRDLVEDNKGNIIVSSYEGVYRLGFDRSTKTKFVSTSGQYRMTNLSIAFDQEGVLWTVDNRGIQKQEAEPTVLIPHEDLQLFVQDLFFDKNNTLWAAGYGLDWESFGLASIDTTGRITSYLESLRGEVLNINIDRADRIWMATTVGLYFFENETLTKYAGIDGLVYDVEIDWHNNLWLSTESSPLIKISISGDTQHIETDPELYYAVDIEIDYEDNIWLLSDGKLVVYNEQTVFGYGE